VAAEPSNEKYRKFNTANSTFRRTIADVPGGLQLLAAVGFRKPWTLKSF
jgi:hypothetical protein